jgi:eukaryotic-like serine/threonine-protein kinase
MIKMPNFFKDIWFIRKNIIINFLGVIVFTFILVKILMWSLDYYTLHSESIKTPDLINMKIEEATKLLETRKLGFVVIDSICRGTGLGGLIKEQSPKPQKRVKESRKIYLTITGYNECTVNLYYDRIIGRDRKYVVRYLQRSNLKIGNLTYRKGGKAKNTVVEVSMNGVPLFIEANPNAGEKPPEKPQKIPQNSVIDLVLIEGVDGMPKFVPDLICDRYDAAEFAIKGMKFNLGEIHTQGSITDTLSAWVYSQRPNPGVVASMGSGIDLWLMSDYPEGCDDKENTSK